MSTRILAIDTATEACSVALWNESVIEAQFEISPREHTQRILPMVQAVLSQGNLSLQQLDALAFGRGPGSFTGVRIGIGVAQGLALGAELPMLGVSSLKTMAQGAFRLKGAQNVLVAIDARMGEVYWGQYTRNSQGEWQGDETEAVLKPEQAQAVMNALTGVWAIAGTGWEAYPQLLDTHLDLVKSDITLPHAEDMLPLAVQMWKAGEATAVEHAEPVYLRNEVTWKKLPGR
ncbi:tRNA (adenosine(37)-N6)-threonylcarbamoyltransferase complex dimerization subunit type 1 TsaB [Xenorhabdus bovienii]|uniref:tRNA threonylcarbamoyladenosine biosynthesis protein TsaB n=1 Tax=Xenorhabdus aichiensis TaxID=3025874 RepID=A0ABT5M1C5_9GAMM|nr:MULTISPECIES: tRNA (adenosine(37)-N6)-threonylcarbamoyltransferase complex dimerization subunit type 1 TsaB [Xenorhabdus]MCP9267005.1 tRNA (adenosine(37)-N6)-threonylcarbamoyltransferase complex dimerization subunit type 1 TsaB [Xenorhabdus bovienii subsp. africana]MDC9620067.1 tRNA (adenosine(37)-N6)-threonylcarbamoyltransferase complex dimerization subunit type 1 TsaB [Xenorhabdus aichiensis]MDE9492542.1 tRNA (adenosine(37)-N6)-threonylcarbamoyltransferase complex dimerization subunit type 